MSMNGLNTSAITVSQNADSTKLDINFTKPTSNYLKKIYLCRKAGTTSPTNALDENYIPTDGLIKTITNNGYNTSVSLDTSLPFTDSGLSAGTDYSYRNMAYFLCDSDVNKKSCRSSVVSFDFNGFSAQYMPTAIKASQFVSENINSDLRWIIVKQRDTGYIYLTIFCPNRDKSFITIDGVDAMYGYGYNQGDGRKYIGVKVSGAITYTTVWGNSNYMYIKYTDNNGGSAIYTLDTSTDTRDEFGEIFIGDILNQGLVDVVNYKLLPPN